MYCALVDPKLDIKPHLEDPHLVALFGAEAVSDKLQSLDQGYQKLRVPIEHKRYLQVYLAVVFLLWFVIVFITESFTILFLFTIFFVVLPMVAFYYKRHQVFMQQGVFIRQHFADWCALGVSINYTGGHKPRRGPPCPAKITLTLPTGVPMMQPISQPMPMVGMPMMGMAAQQPMMQPIPQPMPTMGMNVQVAPTMHVPVMAVQQKQ